MNIPTTTTAMLAAINQSELNVFNSESQEGRLNLGNGKEYIVKITCDGDVSVNRDLSKMTTAARMINALVDFFSRLTTNNESAFTTRATQMKSQLQSMQKSHHELVSKVMDEVFSRPLSEFKNVAQYINKDSSKDIGGVSFNDVPEHNRNRLGLESFTDAQKLTIKNNFPVFITMKDALFHVISNMYIAEVSRLNPSNEDTQALGKYYNQTVRNECERLFLKGLHEKHGSHGAFFNKD